MVTFIFVLMVHELTMRVFIGNWTLISNANIRENMHWMSMFDTTTYRSSSCKKDSNTFIKDFWINFLSTYMYSDRNWKTKLLVILTVITIIWSLYSEYRVIIISLINVYRIHTYIHSPLCGVIGSNACCHVPTSTPTNFLLCQ